MRALEREILGLQDSAASSHNEEHINALRCKKKMLDDLLNVRAQGALVRSRFQNVIQMDAPSKFFVSLEQTWASYGPRATSGPLCVPVRPIMNYKINFKKHLCRACNTTVLLLF